MMTAHEIEGPRGSISVLEYMLSPAEGKSPTAFALLLPGTSIRPGPGAAKHDKYHFGANVPCIYRDVGLRLAEQSGIPSLQLSWRRYPADGGTTKDAIHDIIVAVRFMRQKYGSQCGALLVGYSFGGAAVLAFLAHCFQNPKALDMIGANEQKRQPWLLGTVALAGALKGTGDDKVNIFNALQQAEKIQALSLIIHGSDDDNVSISAAEKLFRQAPQLKSLCILQGAGHYLQENWSWELVVDACCQWLSHAATQRSAVSSSGLACSAAQAQQNASAALCSCERVEGSAAFAFDPEPRTCLGGYIKYTNYELPLPGNPSQRALCSDKGSQSERVLQQSSKHAERQRKARERQYLQRIGNLPSVIARFQATQSPKGSLICQEEIHEPRAMTSRSKTF